MSEDFKQEELKRHHLEVNLEKSRAQDVTTTVVHSLEEQMEKLRREVKWF